MSDKLEGASSVPLNVEAKFEGSFGTGNPGVASFGPRGTIQYKLDADIPIVAKDVTMSMKGDLYLVFTFWGLEAEGKVCETDEYIFFQNKKLCWVKKQTGKSLKSGENDEFTINMSRSVMKEVDESDGTFVTNICGYNTPAYTVLNDGRMLAVWTADDSERGAADKNALYYSVRSTEGVWSDAAQVENDGTLDSEPRIYDLDGDIWLAWQNYSETYGEGYP